MKTEKTVFEKGEWKIVRWIAGFAYPKNGNAFDTSPRYTWTVYRNGEYQGSTYSRKKANEIVAEG